jgi:hypothetical protein
MPAAEPAAYSPSTMSLLLPGFWRFSFEQPAHPGYLQSADAAPWRELILIVLSFVVNIRHAPAPSLGLVAGDRTCSRPDPTRERQLANRPSRALANQCIPGASAWAFLTRRRSAVQNQLSPSLLIGLVANAASPIRSSSARARQDSLAASSVSLAHHLSNRDAHLAHSLQPELMYWRATWETLRLSRSEIRLAHCVAPI